MGQTIAIELYRPRRRTSHPEGALRFGEPPRAVPCRVASPRFDVPDSLPCVLCFRKPPNGLVFRNASKWFSVPECFHDVSRLPWAWRPALPPNGFAVPGAFLGYGKWCGRMAFQDISVSKSVPGVLRL